mmetsp:Transcript_11719/g.31566  ORF Transcript_11719/g.31566 Transcript_11719/m.31566 type:complete len:156 (+) Transcript_11719:823-1290(+)
MLTKRQAGSCVKHQSETMEPEKKYQLAGRPPRGSSDSGSVAPMLGREPTGDAKEEYAPYFDFDALNAGKREVWKKNPMVVVGALTTAGILFSGLYFMKIGNAQMSQNMMRARVVAQGVTIALLVASTTYVDPVRNGFPELVGNFGGDSESSSKSD